ncbi:MAG: response regulator [Acidobacteriia bacterium]|nr:response regulator [Terriglobia bacterium]
MNPGQNFACLFLKGKSMQAVNSYKVLVVEDEGLIAHDIATRLEALGHQVVATVATAEEAVEQAAGADVVLMDIRIDGPRDGIVAAQEVRARHHVPVVFLTAHADRATLERAKAAEPFGYITKPLGPASLHTSIELAVYKHRMERQLEEQEAWYRTTLASVAEAVVVVDNFGRIRTLNRAAEAFSGWIAANAIGQRLESVVRLVEEESGHDLGDPAPLAVLRGAPVPLDHGLRLISRSGREIAVEGTVAPVRSASENLLGVVLTLRDVSTRRWEERQLRQAQRVEAAGRLAAQISAEYASLVQIIRSRTALLARQLGDYAPAQNALEEIRAAAIAAEEVTEKLAGLGARHLVQPEIVSLNAILRRMSKPIEMAAGSRVITAIQPEPGAGRIKADPSQIEQVIMNLVLHACAVIPEGGRLLIQSGRAEAPRHRALASFAAFRLTYAIAEPDPDHLFDPAGSGQDGLALSLAHSIAAEHGGYLTARSNSEGTRIELLLPHVNEESHPPELASGAGQSRTVLLVDGRDRVRAQLHKFFESAGYNLLEASDREEAAALGQVHEGILDLLIADAADTDPILSELRAKHPDLDVLTMVDLPETSPREIRRPFTQQALLERTASLLERREALRVTPAASPIEMEIQTE